MSTPDSGPPASQRLESDRHFRLLVEQVVDYAMFMLDPRGIVATWNRGAQRIKGYAADEIIGEHFSRFYPDADVRAQKPQHELETAAAVGRFEDEGWRIRKDGSRFWANVVITALRDEGGELLGYAKVTRDLTERKRAEEARAQLEHEVARREARERIVSLLTRIHGVAGSLAAAETPEQVADVIVTKAGAALDASAGAFFAPKEGELEMVRSHGLPDEVVERWKRFAADARTVAGDAFCSRQPRWIESAADLRERYPSVGDVAADTSAVALPLTHGDTALGVVSFRFDARRTFPPEERALLESMATQAAQALERARAHAREVFARASLTTTLRSIGDAVIATDPMGAVTLMNPVAEALTGWSEEEARGRPLSAIFRIVNEHTRATVPNPVDKVLELGIVVGLANHTLLIARDGREIPIDDSGAPIRSKAGVDGVVLVFRDVTEKKIEENRKAFLAAATTTLAASLDYSVTLKKVAELAVPRLADWCAVDLVQGLRGPTKRVAVAHVDPEKIALAKDLDAKYPPDPDAPRGVPNVLRTGRSELYREISDELLERTCVDADHLRIMRALRLRSAMIVPLSAGDRVLGALSFVHAESGRSYTEADLDLGEELGRRCATAIDNATLYASAQRARETADVANRAKDEFLAVVSHELRTPLNAILGWSRMLSAAQMDETRRGRAIETIERNAVAMAQLIEDLLDLSRVISGKMRLDIQQVDLVPVIEAALDSIKPAADVKGVRLLPVLDGSVPSVGGDPTRLQQIVWNLLSNAVKFTPRGGRVEVLLKRSGSSVELAICDTGKGIDSDFLPHVFDPFRQQDATTTRARGGLGLGLAITRQLVELHGGRIEAESAGEGHGATFRVCLPVTAVVQERAATSQPPRSKRFSDGRSFDCPPQLKDLSVLVVDDDEDALQLIKAVLEECGCRVETARSVDAALTCIARAAPDVLLSDIGMPGRDGFDLIRHVRGLPVERGGAVPAAALTAYTRAEDRQRILQAGFSMHVPKPVEPAELLAVMASLTRFLPRQT